LVRSNLLRCEVEKRLELLTDTLFEIVPTGVGRGGKYKFDHQGLKHLMRRGPAALIDRGLATRRDIAFTEADGYLEGAEPDYVSKRALDRGFDQCGTLGSGNHFLEVQFVDRIFDEPAARAMGLSQNQVCTMIHSGSRGLGYQVCDDALRSLRSVPDRYNIKLPDQQLVCAPVNSEEGSHYLGAMRAAANFAWCNRQLLMWQAREVFAGVFGRSWEELEMNLVYDVAHNIAKLEQHLVDGVPRQLLVHRKGATRAFPPFHAELPDDYRPHGQPVLIPGDMGRASWVLAGQPA
jgi:tRNA-splicing ligase RtcB